MDNVTVRHIAVEDFDIVIVYSDGFSDNLESEEIPECLQRNMKDGLIQSLSSAADCLARKAHILGKDPDYMSPFNREWKKAYEEG